MSPDRRSGFRPIDLVVASLVLALLLLLGLPATQEARGPSYRMQCSNNMRQLGLALLSFSVSKNEFPNAGTFRDNPAEHGGDPNKSNIYRSIVDDRELPDDPGSWLYNWVVDVMPYLDQPDIAN